MLILTRHPTDSILIADTIKITVISIDGDRVRLGIDAPRTTTINRLEVVEAIEAAKRKETDK